MASGGDRARAVARVAIALMAVAACACVLYLVASAKGLLPEGGAGTSLEPQAAPQQSEGVGERTFSELSWTELKEVADKIEEAPDEDSAREVARSYGIIEEDGSLTQDTIRADLTNGYSIDVRVVDVLHDDKADGSGKAGLTLMTVGALARGPMNERPTADGGWESSYARAWLAADGLALLPDDLRQAIVPVTKYTNNVGDTNSPEEVSATIDELWLFSPKEVCGTITWETDTYGDDGWGIDESLNQEGYQYRAFAEHGVTSTSAGDGFLRLDGSTGKSTWWYRTPQGANWARSGANDLFYQVMNSGVPKGYGNPDESSAYVVGFCL
ncbi:MAG: DUF6273 domain-containing protein [Olsenella sp.]|jgi:hypothetical protein